jgi:hypothetical protein
MIEVAVLAVRHGSPPNPLQSRRRLASHCWLRSLRVFLAGLSPTSNHTDDDFDVVAYLIDECGFHPGDLVDARGNPLPRDKLMAMAAVCHLEREHGFSWDDLESDPEDSSTGELRGIHESVAPGCHWPFDVESTLG